MSLKLYRFAIRNERTGQTCGFIGQGETIAEAFKEGSVNLIQPFRPSSNGAKRPEHGVAVIRKDGTRTSGTLAQFESDIGVPE